MSFAPQQNWDLYRSLTDKHQREFLRNLTVDQRFQLYQDMYRVVCVGRDDDEWRRLEQRRWEEKLASRLRMVEAFAAMDRYNREQALRDRTDTSQSAKESVNESEGA